MKNVSSIYRVYLALLILWGSTACTDEIRNRLEPTPVAISSLNQLAIITDQNLWDGPIGDSIEYYYGSAFPILPTPEPLFDLKHFTPAGLKAEPTRCELKAYIILADLSDLQSETSSMVRQDLGSTKIERALGDPTFNVNVGRDKWATDQIIIYLFARDHEQLLSQIGDRFSAISKVIQKKYENQIDATVYLGGPDLVISNKIRDRVGVDLSIPKEYIVAIEEENLVWIRNDRDEAINNLIISRLPYTSQDEFSVDHMINLRNEFGKRLVSSTSEGSYMTTNDIDLPVVNQQIQLADSYAMEARGIWEMVGEFMGGPFITYLILDQKSSEIIFIDAFVFAPGKRKRNYMLQLEHIISSISI